MKYLQICFVMIGIIFSSCDVLNQDPQTAISEDIAIHDQKSAQAALNGLYSELQASEYYGYNFLIMGDVSSDISQSVGSWDFYREMDTYLISPGNDEVENFWSQAYSTVNHANYIIMGLPELDGVTQASKDQMLGEAYFIRGLAYFDLTKTFGGIPDVTGTMGVPLVTKPTRGGDEINFPSRASLADSYGQIESDLKMAESLLSGFDNPNRASEASAKALLSRLYLYISDFNKAEQYATDVIEKYNFALIEEYAQIFAEENTSEAIFELAYNTTDQSEIRNWYFPSSEGGRGDIAIHKDYLQMIQSRPDDERGELFAFDSNVGVYYPTKYAKPGNDDNIEILRLAEMYLNRAEARARKATPDLSGALEDLNVIRNRANLADTTGANVDAQDEILKAIELERGIEFIEENHRFFDLVRTGRAQSVLINIDRKNSEPVSLVDSGRNIFPIPSSDIDANENLKQNAAYQ